MGCTISSMVVGGGTTEDAMGEAAEDTAMEDVADTMGERLTEIGAGSAGSTRAKIMDVEESVTMLEKRIRTRKVQVLEDQR